MPIRVLVRHDVCAALAAVASGCAGRPESGGILLGRYRRGDIEVTAWTIPGPGDERRILAFLRDDPLHQRAATQAWVTSHGTKTWVGEWHSHPAGPIQPSGLDLQTWLGHVREERRPMVFALATPTGWGLFVVTPDIPRAAVLQFQPVEWGEAGIVFLAPSGRRLTEGSL